MKKSILSLLVAMIFLCSSIFSYAAGTMDFTDLKDSKGKAHWSAPYINDIAAKGLVSGYSDGTFRPNSQVSRVDAVVFMARLYPAEMINATYAENKSKWTAKLDTYAIPAYGRAAVIFALENSWFGEAYLKEFMNASTKKPKEALRYEFCVYLVRALNWDTLLSNAAVVKYTDSNTIVKQAVAYIELLGRKGIVATTGNFNPNKPVTRGETAKMLSLAYPNSEKAKAASTGTDDSNTGNTDNGSADSDKVIMPSGVIVEGIIKYVGLDDSNMVVTIEDEKENILSFSNKASGVVISLDEKSAKPEDIKVGYRVKLYTDSTTVKGLEALSKSTPDVNKTLDGEIISVKLSSMMIKVSRSKTEEYDIADKVEIEKDKKVVKISELMEGDEVTVKIENSLITKIEAETVKRTLKNVIIKGIVINSNSSAKLAFMDEDGDLREMNITGNSVIFMKNKRASISDVKIGYEADIYASSNEVLDLTLYSETRGEVFTGRITEVNIKSDYFYIETADGKSKKVIIDSKTDVYEQVSNRLEYPRDLEKGFNVS
ncbi:MAG: S-layer homology domain-containing protein, partial [Proteocatella sp.]